MNLVKNMVVTLGTLGVIFGAQASAFGQPLPVHAPAGQRTAVVDQLAYEYLQWHESTSDAVLQDALPNTGRMFILYYKSGESASAQQQWEVEDVARNWGGYITNSVRFYKIDVDQDVTTNSQIGVTPTMLMVVPDSQGKLKVLASSTGLLTHEQTYDFFQKGMENQDGELRSHVSKVTPDKVGDLLQSRGLPVVTLYYDGSSFLSAVEQVFFDQLAVLHSSEASFLKIDVSQCAYDSGEHGVPSVRVYDQDADGSPFPCYVVSGFRDLAGLEAALF